MMKLYSSLLLSLIIVTAYAQNVGSPYTSFGIGEVQSQNNISVQSMQNISVYTDSIQPNFSNPASLASLRLVNFSGGLTLSNYSLKTSTETESVSRSDFNYIALAFPIHKKAAMSFGIMPYSVVNYSLTEEYTAFDKDASLLKFGVGGINQVFFSLGVKPFKNLSLGMTLDYNYGLISITNQTSISGVELTSKNDLSFNIGGLGYTLAANYSHNLTSEIDVHVSAVFDASKSLSSNNSSIRSVNLNLASGRQIIRDRDTLDLASQNKAQTKVNIPAHYRFGVGIGKRNKWLVGLGLDFSDKSTQSQLFLDTADIRYANSHIYRIGGFWTPKYDDFENYFNRITYRYGFSYEDTGIFVESTKINKFGMSIGLGLPISLYSKINFGLEYYQKGTRALGLVEENYWGIKIGLSFNDVWFVKRKFN